MLVEFKTLKGHRWPADDPLLAALERNTSLKQILSPILHHIGIARPEGPAATSFFSQAPKVLARAYWHEKHKEAVGAVFFTPDAAGSPSRASGGAVSAAFDNIIGVCSIEMTQTTNYTVSFTTHFHSSVPLGVPLPWRVWASDQSDRRLTLLGELRCMGTGKLLSSFEGVFATTAIPFPDTLRESVRAALTREPPLQFQVACPGPWHPIAESIASQLQLEGYVSLDSDVPQSWNSLPEGQHFYDFEHSSTPKLRARHFFRDTKDFATASILHFTASAGGPPGRANGGAILAAFEACLAATAKQIEGFVSLTATEITVTFLKATPLGCVGLLRSHLEHGTGSSGQFRIVGELRVPICDGMNLSANQPEEWSECNSLLACTATSRWSRHSCADVSGMGQSVAWLQRCLQEGVSKL